MLFQTHSRKSSWLILAACMLLTSCEENAQDNPNSPANHAKRSRELEQRLNNRNHKDFKTDSTRVSSFDSLRAERDRKLKEAELRQQKLQIANIFFTNKQPPKGVSVQGLSSPEPWGSWSVGDKVTLRFDQPLPTRFKLKVVARAYGPNAEKPITLLLGKRKESMIFKTLDSRQSLEVNLKTPIDTLTFVVPKPTSPADMKESADDRKLGIGLVNVLLLRTSP